MVAFPAFLAINIPYGRRWATFRIGWRYDANCERGRYIADVIIKLREEQPLFQTGRVRDHDVEVAARRGREDLPRRAHHRRRRGPREGVEQRQRTGLLDRVGRTQPEWRLAAAGAPDERPAH